MEIRIVKYEDSSNMMEAETRIGKKYVHILSFEGMYYETGDESMIDSECERFVFPSKAAALRSEYGETFKLLESLMRRAR